jgi:hypothetical protein
MSNVHPTGHIYHSSTAAGYTCYILRTIFLRGSLRLSWGFIGGSSPDATVEGAWRPVLSHRTASPYHTAAGFIRELRRLPNHTEGCTGFSHLPAPQRQAHSEEQIVVVTLSPRLEGHIP